jgi:hypothetical protein
MAKDKKEGWRSTPEEIIVAFEAGIRFGRKMESRDPRRIPVWSEDEWEAGLAQAAGTRRNVAVKKK